MRVLVTGADGLLGSNLVRELLADDHSVRCLILPGSRSATLDGLPVEKVEGDVCDEGFSLSDAMAGCDGVFHCAAITDLWADADLVWKVNFEGTRRVLNACLAASIKRLVFVSSASCFEPGPICAPGDETGAFPAAYRGTPYVESKHRATELVREYANARGLDAVIVAPTFLLGPYDARPSGGELVRQFIRRPMAFVPPGGRSFAYAPDVARAMLSAMDKGRTGQTYILGGHNLCYRDFFSQVAKIAGLRSPRRTLPGSAVLLAGTMASFFGHIVRKRPKLNRSVARFSLLGAYYSSTKATDELGASQSPIETGTEDSIRSLSMYRHLRLEGGYFDGKVALVTGGSRGVGFATARALALAGAKVVITARGETRLQEAKDRIERLGGAVVAVAGDVASAPDAERMIRSAVDHFGRLDIVINNAGLSMRGQFAELCPEVCRQVTATNLIGCLNVSQASIGHLIDSKGQLVFISSIAGLFGLPGASVYCATKKALTGLAESLRIELIPKGVHVGVVYLGFTEHDPEKRIIMADGSLEPPGRPAHHSQAHAAALIVRLLRKRKRQLIMTPAGVAGWLAYRLSPTFVERAILRAQAAEWGVFKRFS
ncbi:MAG: SDR family NAD(P)-dependent oxidoreductase [Phycisphaerae bacterium]|nr:SDR family NAD(P)-dependent oxidoreductase [Phycisphaerae bacterium]